MPAITPTPKAVRSLTQRERSATATPLVRNGQPVAVVAHHSDPVDLERGLGAAVRLALDNERLQAEVRSQVHELTDVTGTHRRDCRCPPT